MKAIKNNCYIKYSGKTENSRIERIICRYRQNILYFYVTRKNGKTGAGRAVAIFSADQIFNGDPDRSMFDPELTAANCINCDLRFGGCYTHKGNIAKSLRGQKRLLLREFSSFEDIPEISADSPIPAELIRFFNDCFIRFGSYGCPTNVPINWVEKLVFNSAGHTGYTHEYRDPSKQAYSAYFMASTHDAKDRLFAVANGWRYFNAVLKSDIPDKTVNCPASKEAGYKTTCAACLLCGGTSKRAKNVYILKH